MTLHLNKLVSPSPYYSLCQVWMKLASGFGEDKNVKSLRQQQQRHRQWTNFD